jgi:hypothetical protein
MSCSNTELLAGLALRKFFQQFEMPVENSKVQHKAIDGGCLKAMTISECYQRM